MKHGSSDGPAAFAAADILNVGDGALDEFAIVVNRPAFCHIFFAGDFGNLQGVLSVKGLVGAEKRRHLR